MSLNNNHVYPTGARRIVVAYVFVASFLLSGAGLALAQTGPQFYVSPYGTATGDGSAQRPWNLATALSHPASVVPGSTIWVREGVYRGQFTSRLKGTASAPITVRAYPGERATIDRATLGEMSTLDIRGPYTIWWGLEIMNSNTRRVTQTAGSHPDDLRRGDGVAVYAARTKLINLIVHDNAEGVAFWTPAVDSEITGLITYNNGWYGPDRGHGHGIYIQNQTGTKLIRDVISFNNFSTGMKAYAQSTYAVGITFDGIMSFNNGTPAADPISNLYVGTVSNPADLITVRNSYLYHPQNVSIELDANLGLGYKSANRRLVVTNNYVAGRDAVSVKNWSAVTMMGNFFYGPTENFDPPDYPSNTYTLQQPTGVRTFVRPNPYEKGRAHIAIFNWAHASSVAVNLSAAGLTVGQVYELRDAQNYFGRPLRTWTYTGAPLTMPMEGLSPDPLIGNAPVQPSHTAPEFGVFVIVPASGAAPTEPPPSEPAPEPPPPTPTPTTTCSTVTLKVNTWPGDARVGIEKSFYSYPLGHMPPAKLTTQLVGDAQSAIAVTTSLVQGSVKVRFKPTTAGTFPLTLTLVDSRGCTVQLTSPKLVKVLP
jgi:hypothetical protein